MQGQGSFPDAAAGDLRTRQTGVVFKWLCQSLLLQGLQQCGVAPLGAQGITADALGMFQQQLQQFALTKGARVEGIQAGVRSRGPKVLVSKFRSLSLSQ